MPLKSSFSPLTALPAYFGGKRRLLPWIFQSLGQALPRQDWNHSTFIDAFAGSGCVSLYAKALGFTVHANDWSPRSQIPLQALVVNHQRTLSKEDVLWLTQPLPQGLEGHITNHYAPDVFSTRHAEALDRVWYWSHQWEDPAARSLGLLLLWHLTSQSVCMGTSIGRSNRPYAEALDGLRDWQTLPAKRFVDGSFPKLLKTRWASLVPLQRRINGGVIGGAPAFAYQQDAVAFVAQHSGDVLYLDPPYPDTLSYESTLKTLDGVLLGPDYLPPTATSPFTKDVQSLCPLLEAAHHIPVWVLSYGNHAIDLDGLVALVQAVAPKRHVQGFAKAYTHLSNRSKRINNQELLVIASQQ